MNLSVTSCFLLIFLSGAVFAFTQEPPAASNLFRDYTPAEFSQLAAAQKEINTDDFNEELLSAAIFHETNKRRAERDLASLKFDQKVRAASVLHAQYMAKEKQLSHDTPNQAKNTTPFDRLVKQGLRPRFSAENVAFNHVLAYEAGKPFYTRKEQRRKIYSYKPGGDPLQPNTYLSFAEAILTQWMLSPTHLKNIVSKEPEFLGVGCALSKEEKGFDKIFADQDFFSPL